MNRRILAGFILLPVVLAMSLIAAVAFLLNRDNGINAHMIANQSDTDRARYAAEAGLQAVNATIQGMGCSGGFPDASHPVTNSNFGGAAYSAYSASSGGTSVTLVSAGSYNGTTVTLTRNNAIVYQSPAVTYTLQPDATAGNDIYIDSANANNNYGNATSMPLKKNQQNVLVKFDLSVLPAGSRPVSATLSLYGSGGLLNGVDLVRLTSAWVEGTGAASPLDGATWNTSNGSTAWTPGGGYHSVKLDSTIGVMGTWTNLDATDIATAWLSGLVPNNGVMLKLTGDLGILQYYSSDNADATKRPKIVFNYLVPCGATGPSDPVSGNVTLSPAADTFDDSGAMQANNGAASTLSLYSTPARDKRILMRFDASVIPTGSTISSAILRLYVSNVGGTTANTKAIWANAVNDAWVEGSGNNTNKNCPTTPTAGASWNFRTDCAGWSYVHPPNTVPAWAAMAPMPTARTNVMVASVGGKVYAIGGRLMSATYLKVVEEYDPATNTWTTKASMPTARSDAGVAVVNGLIYVMGGDTGGFSASSANEAYNPATNTWASKAAMTTGRRYLAAAAVNGKIYTLGGAKTSTAVKNNEMYDPPANTWTTKKQMFDGQDVHRRAVRQRPGLRHRRLERQRQPEDQRRIRPVHQLLDAQDPNADGHRLDGLGRTGQQNLPHRRYAWQQRSQSGVALRRTGRYLYGPGRLSFCR